MTKMKILKQSLIAILPTLFICITLREEKLYCTNAARFEDLFNVEPTNSLPTNSSSIVWQPLRASFRPLNRQPFSQPQPAPEFFEQPATTGVIPVTTAAPATTTPPPPTQPAALALSLDDEDLPTRVPLNRFRPTRPPSVDPQTQPQSQNSPLLAGSGSSAAGLSQLLGSSSANSTGYRISQECFECICEASTSCNINSRCQTSDVRHTRCGLFLISYDQWLESGLSRQLVSREALARDAAADERAFYECVTDRDCAERLLAIYMQRKVIDCDKDGRIDCYDVAAIHQGGTDHCASESLLDSQYWSEFNACFGFGR